MMRFKLGKRPARPDSIKLRFRRYFGAAALPKAPDEFGHERMVAPWHMLGNSNFGCCVWSGAAHETYLFTAEGSERAHVTTADVLDDYAACTGFKVGDLSTDQGTDMQQAAAYRQKIGIRDGRNTRHKIGAYAALKPGDADELATAAWLFTAVGVGLEIGDNQQQQFVDGQPWGGPTGANTGGHYVPVVARRGGLLWCVSWGRLQAITPAFLEANNDESVAYFAPEYLKGGKSPEGFDTTALSADLADV